MKRRYQDKLRLSHLKSQNKQPYRDIAAGMHNRNMLSFNKSAATVLCLVFSLFISAVSSDAFSSALHPVVPPTATLKSLSKRTTKAKSNFRPRTLLLSLPSENNGEGEEEDPNEKEISPSTSIPRGGGADVTKPPPPLPSLGSYIKFALPCLGLWVAQPLMSLVDTSFVGLSGGSTNSAKQLAALGPATTFFDGATYLFAFLNVATTNLYSSARAQNGEQSNQAESVVRTASRVAWRCGLGLMVFLLAFSRPLLSLYIGTSPVLCGLWLKPSS